MSETPHDIESANKKRAVMGTKQDQNPAQDLDPAARRGQKMTQDQCDTNALATPEGLEPSTCGLEVRCSIQLS